MKDFAGEITASLLCINNHLVRIYKYKDTELKHLGIMLLMIYRRLKPPEGENPYNHRDEADV